MKEMALLKKCVIILNPESGKKKKIKTYQDFNDVHYVTVLKVK